LIEENCRLRKAAEKIMPKMWQKKKEVATEASGGGGGDLNIKTNAIRERFINAALGHT